MTDANGAAGAGGAGANGDPAKGLGGPLLWGFVLSRSGAARAVADEDDAARSAAGVTAEAPVWLHLHAPDPGTPAFLRDRLGLDPVLAEAMLEAETQPRSAEFGDVRLVILRAVNMNPGAEPEDMVSLRAAFGERLVVTARLRPLMAARALRDRCASEAPPRSAGAVAALLASGIVDRMGPPVLGLRDGIDAIEEAVLEAPGSGRASRRAAKELPETRRRAVILRRYIAPQQGVLLGLARDAAAPLDKADRSALREAADDVARLVADLEAVRDRAAVIGDELQSRASERSNRTTYVLTVLAGLFLPVTAVSGLLGMNVGGIPLADSGRGFVVVCVLMLALVVATAALLARLR